MRRLASLRIPRLARALALSLVALAPAACYVAPYPYDYSVPASFDRSWEAVIGAMQDSGLAITRQDRASGTVVGSRGATDVIAQVQRQGDGTVRVEFTTRRANNEDPGLIARVTSAYQQRMGR